MDFLGPWPWYILSLEGVLLAFCLILYAPFAIRSAAGRGAGNRRIFGKNRRQRL
jgi:uncharacterized membrane protein YwaF